MRTLLVFLVLAVGACEPTPPDGAYLCSAVDDACPSDQHCRCGTCVRDDANAVCSIALTTDSTTVYEHQSFSLKIDVLDDTGAPSAFEGTIKLSSSWGDVVPDHWDLASGNVATVSLDRETTPPAAATLHAASPAVSADSASISVLALPFDRNASTIIGSKLTGSDQYLDPPTVTRTAANDYVLFVDRDVAPLGAPTVHELRSTDGVEFAETTTYTIQGSGSYVNPFSFLDGQTLKLTFSESTNLSVARQDIDLFAYPPTASQGVLLSQAQCGASCASSLGSSSLVPVADVAGLSGWMMFYTSTGADLLPNIGAATATSAAGPYTPLAAPVLSGSEGDDAALVDAHVVVDGTVLKMWYSFARFSSVFSGNLLTHLCDPNISIFVGYATSADGVFWVRSPTNSAIPALSPFSTPTEAWDGDARALLLGAVLPWDDTEGFVMYYAVPQLDDGSTDMSTCQVRSIGRVTAPPVAAL